LHTIHALPLPLLLPPLLLGLFYKVTMHCTSRTVTYRSQRHHAAKLATS
jgi:hypothetical protein